MKGQARIDNLINSNNAFESIVLPNETFKSALKSICQFDEYFNCEYSKDEILRNADFLGIDAGLFYRNMCVKTLAIRVRPGNDWQSFTLRFPTEFQKKLHAFKTNDVLPQLTVQAHIVNNRLASFAIIDTAILIQYANINFNSLPLIGNKDRENSLLVVDWHRLDSDNIRYVKVILNDDKYYRR